LWLICGVLWRGRGFGRGPWAAGRESARPKWNLLHLATSAARHGTTWCNQNSCQCLAEGVHRGRDINNLISATDTSHYQFVFSTRVDALQRIPANVRIAIERLWL